MIWHIVDHAGSFASILGLLLGCYILWREVRIDRELLELKLEEEGRHHDRP